MRVHPLTPELCDRIVRQASKALLGDRTCSIENIRTSCFASEFCALQRPMKIRVRNMLFCRHAFVALDDETQDFVGCVSSDLAASTLRTLFPGVSHSPTALLLSNLCVDHNHRRRQAGQKLMKTVLALSSDLFLLVVRAQYTDDTAFAEMQSTSESKLMSWYMWLGFEYVQSTPVYHLFKKIPCQCEGGDDLER